MLRFSLKGRSLLGTFALVFVCMAAIFAFDVFLARVELSETQTEAARLFAEGQRLERERRTHDAVKAYRDALSFARNNFGYQLALSRALLTAGKTAEAEAMAADLLRRDSTDGDANLLMARILTKTGNLTDAIAYYHRAIYGHWQGEAPKRETQARMELIDLLARQGMKKDLLAELLALEDAVDDAAVRERMANLFLAAGSPARAAELFREILHRRPNDASAYAGLGESEFARGNYRIALAEFQAALRLEPAKEPVRKRVEALNEVFALDPSRRGLSVEERYRRSVRLLELATEDLNRCTGASAQQALKREPRGAAQESEATEANLDLAGELWQTRKKQCSGSAAEAEQPFALVMAKVVQQL
jgi:tetratricopeptide (TPR) repeat protein